MFRKVLIANRGEIAVRIAATCRRLGIPTVAVYSDADREACHVEASDEARWIGPPPATESYLAIDRVVAAAVASGAEAIHPGYGFLSENADFADAVRAAGIAFVGPSGETIRSIGSKSAARRLAREAGVPVVPGFDGEVDDAKLAREADAVGWPLMIKAVAGGGGRGIRIVERAEDFARELSLARREAASSFGDDRVLLERVIRAPRHVEVQVAGDGRGGAIHLLERECSIQRRHQKVVEEAPAPSLPGEVRTALHDHALTIASAVRYEGLGTVEFLYEAATGQVFFLEVNPRLQVEHPVTELVTGLDLVEMQLRIAVGEGLPLAQSDVVGRGSAIEVRLCAEVPSEGFRPATGRLERFLLPDGPGVRVDSGFEEGRVVSPHYDSLLAKVIAHAETRELAARRLGRALDGVDVAGVETNVDFLRDIVAHPAFAAAELETGFLSIHDPITRRRDEAAADADRVAAALTVALGVEADLADERGDGPWSRLGPWRVLRRAGKGSGLDLALHEGTDAAVRWQVRGWNGSYEIESEDGGVRGARAWWVGPGALRFEIDGVLHKRNVSRSGDVVEVDGGGVHRRFVRERRLAAAERAHAAGSAGDVVAPIPGRIEAVPVEVGAEVAAGDVVAVLEAMKMIHELRAPGPGRVSSLHCRVGDVVEAGRVLVEIGEAEPEREAAG